ncbi:MAG: LysR substrate-binding domain-containing protein [Candidatus Dactylopiibacterium sp.]|nr:LysR substrate-binding domain-containing protein [Candidatus Dactylopiibacterium sp.]
MEIRQLKYFIAVAEERNISRAAARLHLSQPPLTRQIQQLEAQLGATLFVRTHAGMELTTAGRLFLDHARQIKSHMEQAAELARRASDGHIGRLDIGVFGSAMLGIVPQILNSFTASHPEVELVLHSAPKGPQIEALAHGRILIAFDRYLPESDALRRETVSSEPVYVALNTRHPLSLKPAIEVADLRGEALIGEHNWSVFIATRELFAHHAFEPHIPQQAPDMITATVMVAGGFGIALVPASVRSLQLPNVVYRPLAGELPANVLLHCAWRRQDEDNPLLGALLATVRAFGRSFEAVQARQGAPLPDSDS